MGVMVGWGPGARVGAGRQRGVRGRQPPLRSSSRTPGGISLLARRVEKKGHAQCDSFPGAEGEETAAAPPPRPRRIRGSARSDTLNQLAPLARLAALLAWAFGREVALLSPVMASVPPASRRAR